MTSHFEKEVQVHTPFYWNQDCDDCWTVFGTPSPTGEYQQLSADNSYLAHMPDAHVLPAGC
jgi:hypothetical protein